jgi:CubicO group peptidase (beta-lactamase class C family)
MRHRRISGAARVGLAIAGCIILATPEPGRTQDLHGVSTRDAQGRRIVDAFRDWATRRSVPNTSIAVMRGTEVTAKAGIGTHTPTTAVPVASMSKAITGVCIARMVDAHLLRFNSRIGTLLADYFADNPPKQALAEKITIGQLLTHSSGITYDPSQGNQGGKIEQLPLNKTNLARQVTITLRQKLGARPGDGYYYYNNMNFAVLGLVIETLTGQAYEDYCYDTVLAPVGVTHTVLNPQWRVMASWGGWKITALNYARFLRYFLPGQGLLNTTPAQWPKLDIGGGAFYSIGTMLRTNGSWYNFWHDGSWSWSNPQSSFGGYFTVIDDDVRYAVNYEPTIGNAALNDLDASLYDAAVGAKSAAKAGSRPAPSLAPQR